MGRSTLTDGVRRYGSSRALIRIAVITALAVLAGLLAAALWLSRGSDDHLPPGVEISGIDVGGESLDDAQTLLDAHVEARLAQSVTFVYPGGQYTIDATELGLQPGVSRALEEAQKSRGAFSRLKARLGLSDPVELSIEYRVEPGEIRQVVGEIAELVDQAVRPGNIRLVDNRIVTQESQPGFEVDNDALFGMLRLLPERIDVPVTEVRPNLTNEAIEAARLKAQALTENPPDVVFRRERLTLGPGALRRALRFNREGDAIAVSLDPQALAPRLRRAFGRFEREPADATFAVDGDGARVIPSKVGRRLAVVTTVDAIVAGSGTRQVRAIFRERTPAFTTARAEELGVRHLVGAFTTEYSCCQPRVTNIQRAAAVLDGTVIGPGGTFSLNEVLGERTSERGFVEAPMIGEGGKLVDAVGGGVSQVATTIFNAAFFSGLELITHTPHSFYISRYPEGREATVSWGGPELVFRNDWEAAVFMRVFASDTAITVSFYSSRLGRRVETSTGERFDREPSEVVEEENLELEPGARNVLQTGGTQGFSVAYTRQVYRGDELVRDERWVTAYDPANTIVEVGPPLEEEEEEPGPDGEQGGEKPGKDGGAGDGSGTEEPPPDDRVDPAPAEPPASEPPPDSGAPASEPAEEQPA